MQSESIRLKLIYYIPLLQVDTEVHDITAPFSPCLNSPIHMPAPLNGNDSLPTGPLLPPANQLPLSPLIEYPLSCLLKLKSEDTLTVREGYFLL